MVSKPPSSKEIYVMHGMDHIPLTGSPAAPHSTLSSMALLTSNS